MPLSVENHIPSQKSLVARVIPAVSLTDYGEPYLRKSQESPVAIWASPVLNGHYVP